MEHILQEKKGAIAWIYLNRPEKLNALTREMYLQLQDILDQIQKDTCVRALVITGTGKSFSAGYDLSQGPTSGGHRTLLRDISNPVSWKLWHLDKPSIAMVRGYALGGGCELALSCDLVIASEDALIGEPEIDYSITPDFLILPWLVGLNKAKELLLLGSRLTGREAVAAGLINRAVPPEKLEDEVNTVARRLAELSPQAVRSTKAAINRTFEIQGFIQAINAAEEISINNNLAGADEETKEFRRVAREQGVKAALAWRESRMSGERPGF